MTKFRVCYSRQSQSHVNSRVRSCKIRRNNCCNMHPAHYSLIPIQHIMAPSRALFIRRIASACAQPQTSMRAGARPISTPAAFRPSCIHPTASLTFRATHAPARSYSAQASGAPEPPDFLNEAELHIFNKIRGELEPTKLEVRGQNSLGGGLNSAGER